MGFVSQLSAVLQWDLMLMMVGSVLFGLIIGILPGVGGSVAIALLIPITFGLDPKASIVVLLSAYGASAMGGSLTSILINTPGDAVNAATAFDGYPLAQQGKAGMAITASMVSSVLGGLLGLMALDLMIPVSRKLILMFSYPDFFMLAVFGMTVIAVITRGNTFRGVLSALFGLLLAFVGTDPIMGNDRFTFGIEYLWDGVDLLSVIIGFFAVTEAYTLSRQYESISGEIKVKSGISWDGVKAVFQHFWLFLRSCFIGFYTGVIPGVGGIVGSFMAYGTAVQMSKSPERFGKGAIEGVIAVESANEAREGGHLLPTLAFGIPASASMAILIGGLMMHGISPGPEMLTKDINLTYFLIATAVVSKFVAMILGLLLGTRMVFVTKIRGSLMAPAIIVIALVGAYGVGGKMGDVIATAVFGFLGVLMQKYGYSRVSLIIALVLGKLVEASYHQSMTTFGVSGFFTRPIALALLLLIVGSLVWPFIRKKKVRVKP
ncbi:MAG TPA: tripartite tricarboxylate transporter permease [Acidiferrobacterales bacterium]|nr:tripartite tricarboxylate transporter permease [Acidiferrobacterales bacterium]